MSGLRSITFGFVAAVCAASAYLLYPVPADSARRMSSSVGLPAGIATSSPSRRTSTGPSIATEITAAG